MIFGIIKWNKCKHFFELEDLIPPGSTLIFEVQLIAIDESKASDDTFVEIDADGDGMLSQDEVINDFGVAFVLSILFTFVVILILDY